MKKAVWAIALILAGIASAWLLSRCSDEFKGWGHGRVECDTVTVTDTIFVEKPIVRDSIIVKTVTRFLRVADTTCVVFRDTIRDSVLVEIPIEQKVYGDSNYTAWVSGYLPKLDSIQVYRRETVIRTRAKRWSIGVQAGYGITTRGFAPYAGVGVTYRIGRRGE